jgi:peptidoglycan hydrolase FlgJ
VTQSIGTITGTTGIASGLDRAASKDNLEKAGKQFEAIFTGMMLKAARSAKLSDSLFDSKAIDTFTEMQDTQVAKIMAEHTPLGIGKAMTDFLSRNNPVPQSDINDSTADPPQ